MKFKKSLIVTLFAILTVANVAHAVWGDDPQQNSNTALGALVGGVIGHQFGPGDGNVTGTVAGAILGGIVGANIGQPREQVYIVNGSSRYNRNVNCGCFYKGIIDNYTGQIVAMQRLGCASSTVTSNGVVYDRVVEASSVDIDAEIAKVSDRVSEIRRKRLELEARMSGSRSSSTSSGGITSSTSSSATTGLNYVGTGKVIGRADQMTDEEVRQFEMQVTYRGQTSTVHVGRGVAYANNSCPPPSGNLAAYPYGTIDRLCRSYHTDQSYNVALLACLQTNFSKKAMDAGIPDYVSSQTCFATKQ